VCICVRERERGRERDIQTDRQCVRVCVRMVLVGVCLCSFVRISVRVVVCERMV
jgi:hypothetical protein